MFIWGNKSDEDEKRKVQISEVEEYCKKKRCVFQEVSAKSGDGVTPAFHELAETLKKIYPKEEKKNEKNPVIEEI